MGEQRKRARWGALTRDQVIATAARSVRAGQFEQLTMRSLGADLGVTSMALYRYVRDKDDILDEVVDRMLARRWRPRANPDDWMAWTTEAAERFRSFLVDQPAALHVYLKHPVVSRNALLRMNAMLKVLYSAGFDQQSAQRAFASVHTHTIGFAALQASRALADISTFGTDEIEVPLGESASRKQFNEGLACLLEGIERRRENAETVALSD